MKKWLIVAALAFTFAPSTARAEWLLTPNVGSFFGSSAADDDWNTTFGASLGWMGEGILGWEADFAWGGSDFFEREVFTRDVFNLDPDFDANLSSFMGNVLVGVPIGGTTGGGLRPYFVGGIGLVTHSVQSGDDSLFEFDESSSNFGFDVGGGVMGFATDTIGFRGDIRYYRGFTDVNELRDEFDIDLDLVDDIDFWRATGGVTFRW